MKSDNRDYDMVANYQPQADKMIVTFIQDVADGTFTNKTEWGLQIRNKLEDPHTPRWVYIHKVGKSVPDRIKEHTYALIKALQWTEHFKIDEDKYWATAWTEVLATSDREPSGIV